MPDNDRNKALKEAQNLYRFSDNQITRALEILERQMNVLHARSQVLLSLAGIVVTVTGFSGRVIAGTSTFAKITVVLGLFVVLLSAVWTWSRVMAIKWITAELEGEPIKILTDIITGSCYRGNSKAAIGNITNCLPAFKNIGHTKICISQHWGSHTKCQYT